MLVGSKALRCNSSFNPSAYSTFTAFGPTCRPAPTSSSFADRSCTSTSKPRWRSATAAVSPPMPAPMITIRNGRFALVGAISSPPDALGIPRCHPKKPRCPDAGNRSERFHRHHAGHSLDGAGDLRGNLEAAGELDLDLGPLAQHQHH